MRSDALTTEQFIKKAKEVHGDLYDYSKVDYKGSRTKVEIVCNTHGVFEQRPDTHLGGAHCYKCGKEKMGKGNRFKKEEVINKATEIHKGLYDYSLIEEYTGCRNKYPIICKKHGVFNMRFDTHLMQRGCPKCGFEIKAKNTLIPQEDVLKRYKIVHNEKYNYPDFEYKGSEFKIKVECPTHGVFEQYSKQHMKGNGCPKCVATESKAEIEIRDFISKNVEIIYSDRTILKSKREIDIFIPSKKLAIEYNGLYWHSENFIENTYHLDKTEDCLKQDIKLIHIFEDEWIYKKEVVKSRLLNLIGFSENKIYARNCEIKEVNSKEASEFLDENHIQGKVGAKIRIGLYCNNELVSIMTFGELRKSLGNNKKEGSFELLRFCNKLNTNVVGGASKLLKHFENNLEYEEIISYADRRWSNGDLYEKLDFNFISKTRPNYFYVRLDKREPRFKYRKDILVKEGYDKTKTEKEIMKERGYNRIYDCGSLKFIKTKKK